MSSGVKRCQAMQSDVKRWQACGKENPAVWQACGNTPVAVTSRFFVLVLILALVIDVEIFGSILPRQPPRLSFLRNRISEAAEGPSSDSGGICGGLDAAAGAVQLPLQTHCQTSYRIASDRNPLRCPCSGRREVAASWEATSGLEEKMEEVAVAAATLVATLVAAVVAAVVKERQSAAVTYSHAAWVSSHHSPAT